MLPFAQTVHYYDSDGLLDCQTDYHIETCHRSGHNARRHNHFQNTTRKHAARIGQPSELAEVVDEGGDGRPKLITDLLFPHIPGRKGTRAVVVDFSVCHHMAHSSGADDETPLGRAAEREEQKRKKYGEACRRLNYDFMPVVMETTGALGQSAKDFFNILSANSTTLSEESSRSSERNRLKQLVTVALFHSMGEKYEATRAARRAAYRPLSECHWSTRVSSC